MNRVNSHSRPLPAGAGLPDGLVGLIPQPHQQGLAIRLQPELAVAGRFVLLPRALFKEVGIGADLPLAIAAVYYLRVWRVAKGKMYKEG